MKKEMRTFSDNFISKHSIKSDIDAKWTKFEFKCAEYMTEHIPSKL